MKNIVEFNSKFIYEFLVKTNEIIYERGHQYKLKNPLKLKTMIILLRMYSLNFYNKRLQNHYF
jgi:hypothetical protein